MLGKGSPVPQALVGDPTMSFTMEPGANTLSATPHPRARHRQETDRHTETRIEECTKGLKGTSGEFVRKWQPSIPYPTRTHISVCLHERKPLQRVLSGEDCQGSYRAAPLASNQGAEPSLHITVAREEFALPPEYP
eukprot:5228553-Amphidinium_carterae.1